MSTIGSAGLGALNLASSAAGTQRGEADTDRVKKNAADQKAAADRNSLSAQTLGDVAEAENSPDRDADGRQPYAAISRPGDAEESAERTGGRPPDALGDRGKRLDLQA